MNKLKFSLLSAVLLLASLTMGCWPFGGGDDPPQSGFSARGEMYVQSNVPGGLLFVTLTNVQGFWQFDNGSAVGNVKNFSSCCGTRHVDDGRVPARWIINAGPPGCGQLTNPNMDVNAGQTKVAACLTPGFVFAFAASPGWIDLQAPPSTMSMTGSGVTTAYGMPRLEYMNPYTGNLIAAATATSVSGDGTWLQANTPDLSEIYSGDYTVFVSNVQADGSLVYIGAATITAYGRDYQLFDPPPPPGECGCPPGGGDCLVCPPES